MHGFVQKIEFEENVEFFIFRRILVIQEKLFIHYSEVVFLFY